MNRESIRGIVFATFMNVFSFSSREGPIDLEAKFEPSLLNTAIYLLGLSQQVSTFTINFQVDFLSLYFIVC
jgi:cation-transporting ATPase 13A1